MGLFLIHTLHCIVYRFKEIKKIARDKLALYHETSDALEKTTQVRI